MDGPLLDVAQPLGGLGLVGHGLFQLDLHTLKARFPETRSRVTDLAVDAFFVVYTLKARFPEIRPERLVVTRMNREMRDVQPDGSFEMAANGMTVQVRAAARARGDRWTRGARVGSSLPGLPDGGERQPSC